MSRARELYEYIVNCSRANKLKKQIAELDDSLKFIDSAWEAGTMRGETTLEELAAKAHTIRIEKLGLQLRLNRLEKQILQFEVLEELRE